MHRPFALFGLVLATLLVATSGCVNVDFPAWDRAHFAVAEYGRCPEEAQRCEWSMQDGEAHLLLEGIKWTPTTDDQTGLHVLWGGNMPLRATIRHAELQGFHVGLAVACLGVCSIDLEDVQLTGTLAPSSQGLDVESPGSNHLQGTWRNVQISGFTTCGAVMLNSHVTVTGLKMRGCQDGLQVLGPGSTMEIADLDSEVIQNGIITMQANVSVRDSRFQGGVTGVAGFSGDKLDVQRVVFEDQAVAGIHVAVGGEFVVDGATFRNETNGMFLSQLIPTSVSQVHNSRFEGITDYAVYHLGTLLLPVDARQNYWGSPLGPTPDPLQGTPLGQFAGARVSLNVDYLPFQPT